MNSVSRVKIVFSICFWNLNGVKNKFMSSITNDVIQKSDILIVSETHFNKRTKCPDNFVLLEYSPHIESKRPRGGVAVYKKIHCPIQTITLLNLPDCTVCEILGTNIVLVAIYIPPSTSPFFKDDSFESLKAILQYFLSHKTVYVLGDLNSRIGDLDNNVENRQYKPNPDPTINAHGRQLRNLLTELPSLTLLNGLVYPNKSFDSNYTFSRGKTASQIDICLTNNINDTTNLKILKKTTISDHNPVTISISTEYNYPMTFYESCAAGLLSYEHYDVNRKIRRTVRLENCDLVNLTKDLEELGDNLQQEYGNNITSKEEVETLNQKITDGIYNACLKNKRRETLEELINAGSANLQNCDRENFQAIADANAWCFTELVKMKDPRAQAYKEKWLQFQELAFMKEKEEQRRNSSKQWKHLYSEKPKKMWELVDWKQNKRKKESCHQK